MTSVKSADTTDTSIWESLLGVSVINGTGVTQPDSIIVLGGAHNGSKTLVRDLIAIEKSYHKQHDSYCIEYTYLRAEEMIEDKAIGVWRLEDPSLALLNFILTKDNIENSIIILPVDISDKPESIISVRVNKIANSKTISKWLEVLESHTRHILAETTEEKTQQIKLRTQSEIDLGIQIIVALTKTDLAAKVAEDYASKKRIQDERFADEYFQTILSRIWRLCNRYGASVIGTSTYKKLSTQKLREYIYHVMYGTLCDSLEASTKADSVFIPSGSEPKLLQESSHVDFEPISITNTLNDPDPIPVKDYQQFLQQKIRTNAKPHPQRTLSITQSTPNLQSTQLGFSIQRRTIAQDDSAISDKFSPKNTLPEPTDNRLKPPLATTPSTPNVVDAAHFFNKLLGRYKNTSDTPQ